MKFMKLSAALTTLAVMFLAPLAAQAETIERQFVSGGTVRLDLSAGDYDIVASRDDRIRITLTDRGRNDPDAYVDLDIKGSQATIETNNSFDDGLDVRIELPRRTHIVLKLTAGDLKVEGIEGSKDVSARAGDVTIAIGARDQYRHVNASIRIGDLNVEPFNVNKGGFFRSFEWNGKGQYDLRAHLTVGDLKLTR
jgi:hypothetical protein